MFQKSNVNDKKHGDIENCFFPVTAFCLIIIAFVSQLAAQIQPGEIVLSEIVIAAPGTDRATGCEYVEFRGVPNAATGNYVYYDVDGDVEQNPGSVNNVRNLQGVVAGSNGLIVLTDGSNCRTFDAGTTVITDPNYRSKYSQFNNGTNSFLLVQNAAVFVQGQDLDANDDGALDFGNIFDGIAVRDSHSSDITYGAVELTRPSGIPSGEAINAATRCANTNVRNSAAAFYYGDIQGPSPATDQYTVKLSGRSTNFPSGGRLSPGAPNVANCAGVPIPQIQNGKIASVDANVLPNYRVVTRNSDGSNIMLFPSIAPYNTTSPSWSRDGSQLVYVNYRTEGPPNFPPETRIIKSNADGTNQMVVKFLDQYNGNGIQPSFSPDGAKVVYTSGAVFVINADGSSETQITPLNLFAERASFSPDGTKIIFSNLNTSGIFLVNADGSNLTQLTTTYDRFPAWSPDGNRIVFVRNVAATGFEIYVMNADTTNQTRLTFNDSTDNYPSFSPDGTKIIFTSARDRSREEIYTMNTDGSNQTRLTFNERFDLYPSWQPIVTFPTQ